MTSTADATRPPMEAAKRLVELHRVRKSLDSELADIKAEITALSTGEVLMAVDAEAFPSSARVDGASVFLWTQVWASPAKADEDDSSADHARLTLVLDELGLTHLKPAKVNTQALSAYVSEQIDNAPIFSEDGEALTLEQRAYLVLPAALVDALHLTEKREVRVTGA